MAAFAVDRSNYRIAYVGYNGYDEATPKTPGHVFKTADGGQSWTNISGDLPNAPVNSLVLDPSYPNTLYAGTDVGAFVTYNGGAHWTLLGAGLPNVAVWQLDMDTLHRMIAAGTHGRGAFSVDDSVGAGSGARPLEGRRRQFPSGRRATCRTRSRSRTSAMRPATGVTITDPVPTNTSFVSRGRRRDGHQRDGDLVGAERRLRREHLPALDRRHRRRTEEEGHIDHERRHDGDLGPGAVDDRLAGRDAARAGVRG